MLGEGPVWDQRSGRLHWVDIRAGLVHRFSPADGSDFVIDVGQPVSAVGLGADGGLVLAIRDGFGLVRAGSDRVGEIIEVEKDRTGNRMNDGRCDPAGRFWAGTMADRWEEEPGAGALYRLERRRRRPGRDQILSGITVANGIDWTPDGRHMYYVDSATRRWTSSTSTPTPERSGTGPSSPPSQRRRACRTGWWWTRTAAYGWRSSAPGGSAGTLPPARIDQEIRLPVSLVTSAAFGGPDLADLYITTARHRLTADERERQPQAGSLFCVQAGTGRQASTPFRLGLNSRTCSEGLPRRTMEEDPR